MDIGSFIVYMKTNDIYKDVAEDVQIRNERDHYLKLKVNYLIRFTNN